jgi:membrane glycosyltransferase
MKWRRKTSLGAMLMIFIAAGWLASWIAPVAVSLVLAAPLSRLSSLAIAPSLFATPEEMVKPAIIALALHKTQLVNTVSTRADVLQAAE